MKAYILVKNEERNIERCVLALKNAGVEPVILDSGSTDDTLNIVERHHVEVIAYDYKNHCKAYNEITTCIMEEEWAFVLDADMLVTPQLVNEVSMEICSCNVVVAPILMYWEGQPLRFSSLCPPKPIAFRKGMEYFRPLGHGEKLKEGVLGKLIKNKLIHDDRKDMIAFFRNQIRYAEELCKRREEGSITWKDWIRTNTPLGIFMVPFVILFIKLGILDGRAGIVYAIDRMIAEALKYRYSLVNLKDIEK